MFKKLLLLALGENRCEKYLKTFTHYKKELPTGFGRQRFISCSKR